MNSIKGPYVLIAFLTGVILIGCTSEENKLETPKIKVEKSLTVSSNIDAEIVELVTIDLNNDNLIDTVLLKDRPNDPGLFTKIEIRISGRSSYIFKAGDAWDQVDLSFLKTHKNLVASKNIFITKDKDKTYILLFGFVYGSGRDEFSIIKIENNNAQMLLDEDLEEIISFEDIDNDKKLDLVCYNEVDRIDSLENQLGLPKVYYVFSIDSVTSFNLPLSIKYNNEHKRNE